MNRVREPCSCARADSWGCAMVGRKEQELPFTVCGILDVQPLWQPVKFLSSRPVLLNTAPGAEPCAKPKAPSSPSTLHPHAYLLCESTCP